MYSNLILGKYNWLQTGESNPPVRVFSDGALMIYPLTNAQGRQVVPSTDGTAGTPYTSGDNVGGKLTVSSAFVFGQSSTQAGWLESVMVLDRDKQKQPLKLLIFKSDPTVATLTDNAALVLSTDNLKLIGYVQIAALDYVDIGAADSVAQIWDIHLPLLSTDQNLYFALQTTGTPTYTNGKGLYLTLGITQG
jgi:hypothetical protein